VSLNDCEIKQDRMLDEIISPHCTMGRLERILEDHVPEQAAQGTNYRFNDQNNQYERDRCLKLDGLARTSQREDTKVTRG
jgi:hypothetical protein